MKKPKLAADTAAMMIATEYVMASKVAIRALMKRRGLNSSDVARLISVNPGTVSRWLSSSSGHFFDLHHYALLCIQLGIPPATLLPPAEWTDGGLQASLKYIITLPEKELAFLIAVKKLAEDCYKI